jgi:hypothetical protein
MDIETLKSRWPEWSRSFDSAAPPGAVLDGEYRYVLWRPLGPGGPAGRVLWIMLNPSTADALIDDPTVRKVGGFSRRWGCAQARIVNLCALRATDPKMLRTHRAPIGTLNDDFIALECSRADVIILAWGGNADGKSSSLRTRANAVAQTVRQYADCPVWHLGLTAGGMPKHPLMLGYNTIRNEVA